MQRIPNKIDSESVYLIKYIQKSLFSFANKINPLQGTFRVFSIKIKFTKDNHDALLMKIRVPMDRKLMF